MQFPSKLIENAVQEVSGLPGIGKKTALRLVLHLLKKSPETTQRLADSLISVRMQTQYCTRCFSISDQAVCTICSSSHRDDTLLCVVEDTKDVLALENTQQYRGKYFVLGGILSPMNGVGPAELRLDSLEERIKEGNVAEMVLALPATIDGDTTAFYISKRLKPYALKVSTIARGIPVGSELEYMDEITLGRSIQRRVLFETEP